jgi:hypothetical protein
MEQHPSLETGATIGATFLFIESPGHQPEPRKLMP